MCIRDSSCPIRCYTEYDVDPLADYDLPTHNSNTCLLYTSSDHECSELHEAMEKLRRGQYIMVREGTAAQNMESLLPLFLSLIHIFNSMVGLGVMGTCSMVFPMLVSFFPRVKAN